MGIDPEDEDDGVGFGGADPWSQFVRAPSLKAALSAIEHKVRVSDRLTPAKEEQIVRMRDAHLEDTPAYRRMLAELEALRAWADLGRTVLATVVWYDLLLSEFRESPSESTEVLVDARDRIGPWLGYACGPPPPVSVSIPGSTLSSTHLSRVLQDGQRYCSGGGAESIFLYEVTDSAGRVHLADFYTAQAIVWEKKGLVAFYSCFTDGLTSSELAAETADEGD